jgi:hypothetical protein
MHKVLLPPGMSECSFQSFESFERLVHLQNLAVCDVLLISFLQLFAVSPILRYTLSPIRSLILLHSRTFALTYIIHRTSYIP